jgi:ribosomal protein L34E
MERIFYKAIIFCSNPLSGYYRFEDKFQIYPLLSENAPKHDKVKMYPVVIEYHVEKDVKIEVPDVLKEIQDIIAKQTHTQNYQRQIRNLLTAVTNYHFYFPPAELLWFTEVPNGELTEEMNNQKSKVGMTSFWFPEMHKENVITKFTDTGLPKIEFVKHPDCFQHLDIDGVEVVKLPQHTDAAIHNFFALDEEAREVVNSATSLIANGVELRTKMKSLSFISLVSSIETMVNYENRAEEVKKCENCGQPMFRVMAKFRDYLLKYASDNPDTKKEVNEIYNIRSKIVHTGLLLFGDNKIDWSDDQKKNEQWQVHLKAMQISRVSLTNWLLMRAQEQKQNLSQS